MTRDYTERVARRACEAAVARTAGGSPGELSSGAKTDMLAVSDRFVSDVCAEVAAGYPLDVEKVVIDDLARRLALRPQDFDVVVLPKQYGDILAAAGAGQVGGMTVTPSG